MKMTIKECAALETMADEEYRYLPGVASVRMSLFSMAMNASV